MSTPRRGGRGDDAGDKQRVASPNQRKVVKRATSGRDVRQLRRQLTKPSAFNPLDAVPESPVGRGLDEAGGLANMTAVAAREGVDLKLEESVFEEGRERKLNQTLAATLGTTPDDLDAFIVNQAQAGNQEGLRWFETPKRRVPEAMSDRIKLAAMFIRDADDERQIKMHRTGPGPMKAYRLFWNPYYRAFISLTLSVHMLLVLFEPPKAGLEPYLSASSSTILAVESILVLIELFNLAVNMYSNGLRRSFYRFWSTLQFVATVAIAIDVAMTVVSGAPAEQLRWSRPFRALLLIGHAKFLRRFSTTVLRALPRVGEVMVLFLLLMIVFGVAGINLFAGRYRDEDGSVSFYNFDDFSSAILTLYLVLQTEAYPDAMDPAIQVFGTWAAAYFVVFTILGVFLLMSVLTAVIFDIFKGMQEQSLLSDRVKERKALLAAFETLDDNQDGFLDFAIFYRLLEELRPGADLHEVQVLFEIMDTDGNKMLDILEFFEFCDMLLIQVRRRKVKRTVSERANTTLEAVFDHLPRRTMRRVAETQAFQILILLFILANTVVLTLPTYDDSPERTLLLRRLDLIFLGVFAFEATFKIAGYGWHGYWSNLWNKFDFVIVSLSVVTQIFVWVIESIELDSTGPAVANAILLSFRSLKLLTGMRAMRLMSSNQRFRDLLYTFVQIMPVLFAVSAVMIMLFYIYGVIGMELFADHLSNDDWPSSTFHNIGRAYLVLYQLALNANWPDLMQELIAATGNRYVTWYFFTFNFLVVVIIVNLLAALIYEVFVAYRDQGAANSAQVGFNDDDNDNEDEDVGQFLEVSMKRKWQREMFMDKLKSDEVQNEMFSLLDEATPHIDLGKKAAEKEGTGFRNLYGAVQHGDDLSKIRGDKNDREQLRAYLGDDIERRSAGSSRGTRDRKGSLYKSQESDGGGAK